MKKLILAMGLVGLVAGNAVAAEMDYAKVDANADGSVSMEEATAAGWERTEEQFKAADADASGGLSADEFKAASGQ
jgi:hypothetical protein